MKYVILRAICKLSNGSNYVVRYNEDKVTAENACSDVELFRAKLKEKLNNALKIMNVSVISIQLTYNEIDGRQ